MKNKTNFLVEKYKIIENTDRRIIIRTPKFVYIWELNCRIMQYNLMTGKAVAGGFYTWTKEKAEELILDYINKREYK